MSFVPFVDNSLKKVLPMLDTDTKRRIDTARDILVGKVPDPKSQVEQITIALIYKFMDDLDAESEELGGERQFFAGEFRPFRLGKTDALWPGWIRNAQSLRRSHNQNARKPRYSTSISGHL